MTVTLLNEAVDASSLKPRHIQKDTALLIMPPLAGHEGPIFGELSVCEDQLYFYSEAANSGIAVEYPDIIIHAISRQDGQPNIYCQLNAGIFFPNQQLPENEEEREDIVTELRLIPRDSGALEGIYMAMSECAALHPDHEFMAEQEDYEDEEFYADPSDEAELNEVQQAALRHLESVFQPAPSMNGHVEEFEDAEESHHQSQ
ncbi:regulator of volume decrease after cellular swelling-domain-containing protein [Cokeromyces recurvatus]|uniref:regulator of volume decrease after cellular swelling-domain-containing protein n=1 Tax=Cokeromyces recurvatus TaxID=90255 RepID=UPI00221F76F7|nr:regulator of volume decrease after cellular swelling-domain-containing protein [Cokeromyces recurvatus]KAI7908008.1 regulator of volume decrease after cellular swelling-domain-containing protein [Cokeromyces recurvatus]